MRRARRSAPRSCPSALSARASSASAGGDAACGRSVPAKRARSRSARPAMTEVPSTASAAQPSTASSVASGDFGRLHRQQPVHEGREPEYTDSGDQKIEPAAPEQRRQRPIKCLRQLTARRRAGDQRRGEGLGRHDRGSEAIPWQWRGHRNPRSGLVQRARWPRWRSSAHGKPTIVASAESIQKAAGYQITAPSVRQAGSLSGS